MNQESQIDTDVNIYFVVPSKYNSENDCTEDMWHAFNKCCEHDLVPTWLTEKQCNKMKPVKSDVFVMEEFDGELFEDLKTYKCPIIGPRCLLLCFINGEPIPEGTSPVYTTAMRGLCVSASGFTQEEKEHLEKLVSYMGGLFTKQLRSRVTHLVTACVISAKYENAIEMKIPVVTKEWVQAIWNANLKNYVKADDIMFDNYKAPTFLNLVVTSTNLPKRQKEEIKQLINDYGGTFMGPLDGSKVKILIAPKNSPMSEKLKYAKQANIACLIPNWVYESIKVGYALPLKDFFVPSSKVCSTPERSNATSDTFNCSGISSIQCDLQQGNYVDESLATTVISNASTMDPPINSISTVPSVSILDRLTFSEAKLAGPFLDGCNIYLAGFAPNHRDKLNRILNVGSATRLDDISDALTHVIIGDETKASSELKQIKSKGLCPYILTLEWLEESIKLKRPAPEENFLSEEKSNAPKQNTEPPSPLSKKSLQMLQKPRRPPIPSFDIDKKMPSMEENKEPDIVDQYLQDTIVAGNDMTIQEFLKPHMSITTEDSDRTLSNTPKSQIKQKRSQTLEIEQNKYYGDDSAIPISQSTLNDRLFEGLTFIVAGFTNEDSYVTETIVAMGGRVVSSTFGGIPDYGVVPKCGTPFKYTVNEIVTDLFIEDCVNQEQIIDITYYHRPLSIKKHANPLAGCVITMSVYAGVERTYLSTLATELGAMCQDIFVRKTNVEKKTYGSTHLVCPTPEGNKYNAAVKWKLPAVTSEWLKACAAQSKLVDETPFLVGETVAPDRSSQRDDSDKRLSQANTSQMGPPSEPVPRNIITPKRHLPQTQNQDSSGDTPLINKRLNLVMNNTPQSPFHVSTPETPYGQVFKPNPSPDTRKGWVKWVNNFPDLRVEEPPLKRRPPSTPLSELKRQLWRKLKNQGRDEEDEANASVSAAGQQSTTLTPEVAKNSTHSTKSEAAIDTVSKKLDFTDENSPLQNNEINLQIAQLDQVLQRTSNTPENRYSLSGEDAKAYNTEPADHIEKCIVKDSQPIDAIVWEDPSHSRRSTIRAERNENSDNDQTKSYHDEEQEDVLEEPEPIKKRKFMLSGIKDRSAYEQVIRDLGGEVSLDSNFDLSATHLLCLRPSRNEKMLGSIASGKWILHCLYLRDSEREGKLLDEEKYEWGNPKSKNVIPDPSSEAEKTIAAAAYKWRSTLMTEPRKPFEGMVSLILCSEEKYDQFKRLIEAGGGKVVQARPPYDTSPTGKKITHCFVNVRQASQPIDWAMLASKGILCFMPQYLSDYLTAQNPLNPRECVIPEFKKYLTLMPK